MRRPRAGVLLSAVREVVQGASTRGQRDTSSCRKVRRRSRSMANRYLICAATARTFASAPPGGLYD